MSDWRDSFVPESDPGAPQAGAAPAEATAPAAVQPRGEAMDWLTALGHAAGQGATLKFGDEINGLVQALGERYLPERLGGGGPQAQARSLADLYRGNRDSFRREDKLGAQEHPYVSFLGELGAGLPLAIATGGGGSTATLGSLLGTGAMLGAPTGLGGSEADLTRGEYGRALADTGLGGLFGMAGGGLGYGLGKAIGTGARWVSGKAVQKATQATEKIAELAKKSAAEATQSARSAAGRDAQALYRTLEHLRELEGSAEPWAKAELAALKAKGIDPREVEAQLFENSVMKLPSAFAAAQASATALGDAARAEGGRFTEAAGRIGNPMNQLKAVAERYWPVMAGGAAGWLLGDMAGLGAGSLVGRGLSPTFRALARRATHPSVQRPAWNTLGALARGVGYGGERGASALGGPTGRAIAPEIEEALLPMLLAGGSEEGQSTLATVPWGRR